MKTLLCLLSVVLLASLVGCASSPDEGTYGGTYGEPYCDPFCGSYYGYNNWPYGARFPYGPDYPYYGGGFPDGSPGRPDRAGREQRRERLERGVARRHEGMEGREEQRPMGRPQPPHPPGARGLPVPDSRPVPLPGGEGRGTESGRGFEHREMGQGTGHQTPPGQGHTAGPEHEERGERGAGPQGQPGERGEHR